MMPNRLKSIKAKLARTDFAEHGIRIGVIFAVTMALTLNALFLSIEAAQMVPVLAMFWALAVIASALQWKAGAIADYAFVCLLFALVVAAYFLQPKADSVLLFESVALLLATSALLVIPIPHRRVYIVFGIATFFAGGYVLARYADLQMGTEQTLLVLWFSLIALSGVLVRSMRESRAQVSMRQIEYLADHDSLTNLRNRRGAYEAISQTLEMARSENQPVAIAVIDIDGLKRFNDNFGHAAGDVLLREVAHHVQQSAQTSKDVTARWGGDEFLAFWYGMDERQAAGQAESLRRRIMNIRSDVGGADIKVDASIGTAIGSPSEACSLDELIRRADQAMYAIKRGHYAAA